METKLNKRLGNITPHQKEVMVEFLKKHPNLRVGKFSKVFSKSKAQELWKELAVALNGLGGAKKEWMQWRKTWHDWRSNTTAKKSTEIKHRNKTGGGSPFLENEKLTTAEEDIVQMLGPTTIAGDQDVIEPNVTFDFDSKCECITLISAENDSTEYKETEINYMAKPETKIHMNTHVNPKSNQTFEKHTPVTKTPSTRIRRLQHAAAATAKLAEQNEQQLNIMKDYYSRKIQIMEEDIKIKQDISNSLKTLCACLGDRFI